MPLPAALPLRNGGEHDGACGGHLADVALRRRRCRLVMAWRRCHEAAERGCPLRSTEFGTMLLCAARGQPHFLKLVKC